MRERFTRIEQPVILKYLLREVQSICCKALAIHSLIKTRRSQAYKMESATRQNTKHRKYTQSKRGDRNSAAAFEVLVDEQPLALQ